jgi:hypothetical protein
MAHSEMFEANDYNILYCKDLYTKPAVDMEKFLELQKEFLPTNISSYSKARQTKNKSIFLQPGAISVQESEARLKSLEEINEFTDRKKSSYDDSDNSSASNKSSNKASTSRSDLLEVSKNLRSPSDILAALQLVSMSTGSNEATKALRSAGLKDVSIDKLMNSTIRVAKLLKNSKLSADNAASFVDVLLKRLQELK